MVQLEWIPRQKIVSSVWNELSDNISMKNLFALQQIP